MKSVYTTGQVARICKVAPRTVSKWFDEGRLRGYRIPGSHDRRIPREHLIRFLTDHGMPLGDLGDDETRRVLVVGADLPLQAMFRDRLRESDGFRIDAAASGFEAGLRTDLFRPAVVIVDLSIGRIDAGQIVEIIRRTADYDDLVLAAITREDDPDDAAGLGFDAVIARPIDGAGLADRVCGVIAAWRGRVGAKAGVAGGGG